MHKYFPIKIWQNYVNSFEHETVVGVDSRPSNTIFIVTVLTVVALLCRYVPFIHSVVGLSDAILPLAFALMGGIFSILSWRLLPNRNLVALFQLLDVLCYTSYCVALGVLSKSPAAYVFLAIYIAGCLHWGMHFHLTALRALTLVAGPFILVLIFNAVIPIYILIATGLVLYISVASNTRERQKLIVHRDRSQDVLKNIDSLLSNSKLGAMSHQQLPIRTLLHDIKNELSFAAWNLDLVSPNQSVEDKKILSDIKAGILHAFSSAQTFFDLEKSNSHPAEIFWTSDICASLDEIPSLRSHRNKLAIEEFPEVTVRGTLELLIAALRNLIENAIDAGAEKIRISAIEKQKNQWLKIEIADNGPGLPSSVKKNIFSPFNTYGKTKGVGLGIYLSARIVESMNGKLRLVSTGANGTVFVLLLPVIGAKPTPSPTPFNEPPQIKREREEITHEWNTSQ